jgi:hypothetical protein
MERCHGTSICDFPPTSAPQTNAPGLGENQACPASLIKICKLNGGNPLICCTDLLTRLVKFTLPSRSLRRSRLSCAHTGQEVIDLARQLFRLPGKIRCGTEHLIRGGPRGVRGLTDATNV